MARDLAGRVVVITGASSGIGRATALMFAERGSDLVLAARREDALREVARECEALGVRALVVRADVSREQEVVAIGKAAFDAFGRIDVWVNNAAVTLFGRFEETPSDVYRRVLEVNVFGYVHGARVALRAFREQGHGVLINNASIVAEVPQPYTSAYVMSKHAILALGRSLRQELMLDEKHDIHVATVMPATIDTPLLAHSANYTGRAIKAMPPVIPAETVARAIVGLAQRPRREVVVGRAGRMMVQQARMMPGLTERMMSRGVDQNHLYRDVPQAPTRGNVFEPMAGTDHVGGGWKPAPRRHPVVRRAISTAAGLAGASVFVAAAWSALRSPREDSP